MKARGTGTNWKAAGTMSGDADGASACGTRLYAGTGWHAAPGRQPVRGRYAAPGGYIVRGRYALAYIHVCGLVSTLGVYGLPAGSRVYEAIEAAGGFSEAAVPDYLNLAQVLEDGMKIQVPDRDQAEEWKARG